MFVWWEGVWMGVGHLWTPVYIAIATPRYSFLLFSDIFFGLPSTRPGSLESKIQDAHKNYLVAELVVERSQKPEWRKYAEFLRLRVKENGPVLNTDQVSHCT